MGGEQGRAGAVRQDVAIWYTGARYELGRWERGYALWAVGGPRSQPLAQWPETPDGWSAAWAQFTAAEPPGAIVHRPQPASPSSAAQVGAGVLLAVGVLLGVAGLFPAYFSGESLVRQPAELVPHAIYLAAWAVSAALVFVGGSPRRAGALLGLGTGIVSCGFFVADIGTVLAGSTLGAGLILSAAGWVAAAAGAVLATRIPSADAPGRPRTSATGPMAALAAAAIAGVGVAITFAPAWDSYTLRTPAGLDQTVTAGNAFANPWLVVAGNVAVMGALVAAVVAAALWRPLRMGAALLAGAAIPMAAQAISAIVQIGEAVSPSQFGISPQQAQGAGLTISSGLTPVFWVYCLFLAALLVTGVGMLLPARRATAAAGPGGGPGPWATPAGPWATPAGPWAAPQAGAAAPGGEAAGAGPWAAPHAGATAPGGGEGQGTAGNPGGQGA